MQLSVAKSCPSGTECKEGTNLTKAGGMRLKILGRMVFLYAALCGRTKSEEYRMGTDSNSERDRI
jgi:hypothetical protein